MGAELTIRPARPDEAGPLSDLALRSKGHWGYGADFLASCRAELTVHPRDCDGVRLLVAERAGTAAGFTLLAGTPPSAELAFLYVEPAAIGAGVGRSLLGAAIDTARRLGIRRLTIDADPHAEGFYVRAGAVRTGTTPSGSIPGRHLPRLALAIGTEQACAGGAVPVSRCRTRCPRGRA